MRQISYLWMILFFAGTEGLFLDWFKSKFKPQSYAYSRPQNSYGYGGGGGASYTPYPPVRVPVWQAMPSGYMAQPVPSSYGVTYSTGSGGYGGGSGYSVSSPPAYPSGGGGLKYGGGGGYGGNSVYGGGGGGGGAVSFPYDANSYGNNIPSSYSQPIGPTLGYDVSSVNYGSVNYGNVGTGGGATVGTYDGSNALTGGSAEYTGGAPMISVPVYFPKDSSNLGNYAGAISIPTTYSNGVSGFYDSSLAASGGGLRVVQAPSGAALAPSTTS